MVTNVCVLFMNVRGLSSCVKKRTDVFAWLKKKKGIYYMSPRDTQFKRGRDNVGR